MRWMFFTVSLMTALFAFLPSAGGNGERSLAARDHIAEQIHRLQPKLTPIARHRLASAVRDTSNACGISWQILLSVAYHESSLNLGAVNHKSKDHGLTQINEKTILTLGLDRHRLMKDERYALTAACQVIGENKAKYGKRYKFWLGMYRSGNAMWKDSVRASAIRYDRMIRRTAEEMGYRDTRIARK